MNKSDSDLGLLRQQLHREQAFFDIELQQAKLFEKDSFDSIKSLIFITRKVYSLHLSILEQFNSQSQKNVSDVPDLSILSKTLPKDFSPTHQRTFQAAINNIISDLSKTAQVISEFIKNHPEKQNYIVFSLLPALFSCLWSQEESLRFCEFFLHLDPEVYSSISRVFLVNPSFFVFLSSIQTDAVHLISSDSPHLSSLLALFQSRSFLFPASVRQLLSRIENPTKFFIDCILTPLLKSPSLYGLVPSMENRSFENMISEIESQSSEISVLVNELKSSDSTIQMQPSEVTLASVIKAHEQLIYLFLIDTSLIQELTGLDLPSFSTEGVYPISAKKPSLSQNQDSVAPTTKNDQEKEDPLEALLRSLVIQLDISRAGANIEDTLDSALMLHAGASRLQFELRIDEFKQNEETNAKTR